MYGERDTPLGLVATSIHPERAGVQLALIDLLVARGAALDGPRAVNAALRNGRGMAAQRLAELGAALDLEAAAGVGDLATVRASFAAASAAERRDGFAWGAQFGRTAVVEFFLAQGTDVAVRLPHHQQTALHWAAHGGHAETVALLLAHGADPAAREPAFDGTPLDWAEHASRNGDLDPAAYREVQRLLG